METMELIRARHSVRQYTEKTIPGEIRARLDEYAEELNQTAGLHIQILYDEPECFNNLLARYGRFVNCRNYIALVGKKAPDLEERCGDAGERLVLKAQELGLNTCWAAMTHGKSRAEVREGGNGGHPHRPGLRQDPGQRQKEQSPGGREQYHARFP